MVEPEVDADDELAARVRRALGTDGTLVRLEGGRSGLTYTLRGSAGRFVVKAVPPGRRAVGRNDVLRQASLLRALHGTGLPVPTVAASDDESPGWFAMTFADGEAVEPILDRDTDGAVLDGRLAGVRMRAAAAVLGALHAIPVTDLVERLAAAGVTSPAPDGPADELARWSTTMHAVPAELRPGSEDLLSALGQEVPAPVDPVLVHGDFRLGNLLCVGEAPSALVDWEIWSIGDPRIDLGWFLTFADSAHFPGVGHPVPGGLPDAADLLDRYATSRGIGTAPASSWFRALGEMKMAAIMGHNLKRHREGTHHDPVQEALPPTIAALIDSARQRLGRAVTTDTGEAP